MTNIPIQRVSFFVDGFNLYHSLCSALKNNPGAKMKWLDLPGLLKSTLVSISGYCEIESISYFTAYAEHLSAKNPDKIKRHKAYVRALTASGVSVITNNFKRKFVWDSFSGDRIAAHEEKETDVAIACKTLEGAFLNLFDTAVIVSSDTDLRPLAETFKTLYPQKRIYFAFPYDRKNRALSQIAPGSYSLSAKSYELHQFEEKVRLPSNKYVYKPKEW